MLNFKLECFCQFVWLLGLFMLKKKIKKLMSIKLTNKINILNYRTNKNSNHFVKRNLYAILM